MTVIDATIVGVTVLMLGWGFWRGLTVGTLALAGFGAGAVLGASLAPLVLDDGRHSVFAPILAFPGALLVGGLVAAVVERLGLRKRRRLDRLGVLAGMGGALLAGAVGLVAAWILGAAATQVDSLRDPVERSEILKQLNALVPPPGRGVLADVGPTDPFPTFKGALPLVSRPDPAAVKDPDIRTAGRSVVRIESRACEGGGVGSGWIAADGIVATNAHVVAGEDPTVTVQLGGRGPAFTATPIWFDRINDLALLRTPELKGIAALPLVRDPKQGASGAMLGFPGGRKSLSLRPARFGLVTDRVRGRLGGPLPAHGFPRQLYGRPIAVFAGRSQPGNSGGPVVDTRGRVVTTVFGGGTGLGSMGVPNRFFRSALQRARAPVDTGPC